MKNGLCPSRILCLALTASAISWLLDVKILLAQDPCDPEEGNPVACENQLPGADPSEWDITPGAGDPSIQGYAIPFSVNKGEQVRFKVNTTATNWRFEIYRLGYYGGKGARHITTVQPFVLSSYVQAPCIQDPNTGLTDCGNWVDSGAWNVPPGAVSGLYFARATRNDTGGASQIHFVVRDDAGESDILLRTSDTTWQAYNDYGGNSFYDGSPAGRAFKISYNRPFANRGNPFARGWLMATEYPLIRWLERNGYDVSYFSCADTGSRPALILEHRVFMSSGHDEYYSVEERNALRNARDAGVHLAFLSGNTCFWKTRWENSAVGSPTAYRTLVCYKETHANQKIDPLPGVWTGTWRDPRFSPPADGGLPENELTGSVFSACCQFNAMRVSTEEGRRRLWRETSLASLPAGSSVTFGTGTVAYEWQDDVDNGYRPAGTFRLSSNSLSTANLLLDLGNTYGQGISNHSVTCYRRPNGALVFSAGTIHWAWGLDSVHDAPDGIHPPVDPIIQQATVNILADMGVFSSSLQPGLVATSPSTDSAPPVVSVTSPASGASLPVNAPVVITFNPSDSGGGVVAGVEVSVNGGTTWHPAAEGATWSYVWTPVATGPANIRARAVDDSGNLGAASAPVSVTVQANPCPCSFWSLSTVPQNAASSDASSVELGLKFQPLTNGLVKGIRFYKGPGNTGTHRASIWSSSGSLLSTVLFSGETGTGWQTATFASPVAVDAGTTYVASYFAPNGRYSYNLDYFATSGLSTTVLSAPSSPSVGGNGVYGYGATSNFPTQSFRAANYWVDVVFDMDGGPDTIPPEVVSRSPAPDATGVDLLVVMTATFSEGINPATVNGTNFSLRDAGGATVPATVSYQGSTMTASLDPSAALAHSTAYTVTLRGGSTGIRDLSDNPLESDVVWTFTTAAPVTGVSIWPSSTVPAVVDSQDGTPYELGVKFRSSSNGQVKGIRFYKSTTNTGTHVGRLWAADGTSLGSVTFTNETASGWQQALFGSPISIQAGQIYVVSYFLPVGRYSINLDYFATSGVTSGVLTAVATGESPNGVYRFGSSGFPTSMFRSANYWVDILFDTTVVPDTTPPSVVSTSPPASATGVDPNNFVTAVFNEALNAATVSGTTFTLQAAGGSAVAATVSYDSAALTATLDPASALQPSTTYTATLRGGGTGIKDVAGNALATNFVWTFTTGAPAAGVSIWPSSPVPSVIDSQDGSPYELGVKFRSSTNGQVKGIRFYKSAANTGTHVGHLWTAGGTSLGTVTFTNETASGWQQALFGSPISIQAGQIYVASCFLPVGRYSINVDYFATSGVTSGVLTAVATGESPNGVYRSGSSGFPTSMFRSANYWVDILFDTTVVPDTTPPSVVSTLPPASATGVDPNSSVNAMFNEALNAATVSGTTFRLENGGGSNIAATVSYDSGALMATLDPTSTLQGNTTYTATLRGGSTGIKDLANNALAADVVWTFTTGALATGVSIWTPSTVPGVIDSQDSSPYELGVKFRSSVNGQVKGIRFYKSAANTGTHVGHLWTAGGTSLGTVTFTNETASGWQQALFGSPISIQAGQIYVASCHMPQGRYSINLGYFGSAGVTSGVLTAVATSESSNGVYKSGSSGFPNLTYNNANYWVDILFEQN